MSFGPLLYLKQSENHILRFCDLSSQSKFAVTGKKGLNYTLDLWKQFSTQYQESMAPDFQKKIVIAYLNKCICLAGNYNKKKEAIVKFFSIVLPRLQSHMGDYVVNKGYFHNYSALVDKVINHNISNSNLNINLSLARFAVDEIENKIKKLKKITFQELQIGFPNKRDVVFWKKNFKHVSCEVATLYFSSTLADQIATIVDSLRKEAVKNVVVIKSNKKTFSIKLSSRSNVISFGFKGCPNLEKIIINGDLPVTLSKVEIVKCNKIKDIIFGELIQTKKLLFSNSKFQTFSFLGKAEYLRFNQCQDLKQITLLNKSQIKYLINIPCKIEKLIFQQKVSLGKIDCESMPNLKEVLVGEKTKIKHLLLSRSSVKSVSVDEGSDIGVFDAVKCSELEDVSMKHDVKFGQVDLTHCSELGTLSLSKNLEVKSWIMSNVKVSDFEVLEGSKFGYLHFWGCNNFKKVVFREKTQVDDVNSYFNKIKLFSVEGKASIGKIVLKNTSLDQLIFKKSSSVGKLETNISPTKSFILEKGANLGEMQLS